MLSAICIKKLSKSERTLVNERETDYVVSELSEAGME